MSLINTIPELDFPAASKNYNEIKDIPFYTGGIYFIYNEYGNLVYIGKSANLRNRLYSHFKIHKEYESFRFIQIDDEFDREIYETYYINKFKPSNNKDKKYTPARIKRKGRIMVQEGSDEEEQKANEEPSEWFLEVYNEIDKITSIQGQIREFNKLIKLHPEEYKKLLKKKVNKMTKPLS